MPAGTSLHVKTGLWKQSNRIISPLDGPLLITFLYWENHFRRPPIKTRCIKNDTFNSQRAGWSNIFDSAGFSLQGASCPRGGACAKQRLPSVNCLTAVTIKKKNSYKKKETNKDGDTCWQEWFPRGSALRLLFYKPWKTTRLRFYSRALWRKNFEGVATLQGETKMLHKSHNSPKNTVDCDYVILGDPVGGSSPC